MYYLKTFLTFTFFVFFAHCSEKEVLFFSNYNLNNGRVIYLNDELKEISGLTINKFGDLLAHNDEFGIVYKIDTNKGTVSEFLKLKNIPRDDFEGIASIDDIIYLITSSGEVYEAKTNGEFTIFKNQILDGKEIEGLCYYKKNNSLLIACKEDMGFIKGVYQFNLDTKTFQQKPLFLINTSEIEFKQNRVKEFSPSGIEYNETTNTFFVISANERAIMEIDEQGKILNISELSDNHMQPEGITFTADGTMIISDEGKSGKAFVTLFRKSN